MKTAKYETEAVILSVAEIGNTPFFSDNLKYQFYRDKDGQLWRRLFSCLKIGVSSSWKKVKG